MNTEKLINNKKLISEADRYINTNKNIIKLSGSLAFGEFNRELKALNKRLVAGNDQDILKVEIENLINSVKACVVEEQKRIAMENHKAGEAKKDSQDDHMARALNKFNEHYAVVKFASRVLVMQEDKNELGNLETKFYNPRDIATYHQNVNLIFEDKKVNVFKEWMEWDDRKTYSGLTFDPSTSAVEIQTPTGILFNRWKGFSIEPEEGNDDDLYWELVKTGLCNDNEEYYQYVRKYLAHMIQKPTEQPLTAIGIVSSQGVGKGAFVETVGELLGSHFNANIKMRDLTGQFTGAMKDLILGFVDEASWGGDKASSGQLKSTITESTARLELKGKDAVTVPTYKRLIFASNNPYYYHADKDDRRLLPLEPNEKVINKGNTEFWDKFWDKKYKGKMQANLLRHLLDEDISDFNPFENLRDMEIVTGWATMYESLEAHERWMYHIIQDKYFNNCSVSKDEELALCMIEDGVIQREQLNASYNAFKKSNPYWVNGVSARDRKMDKYLSRILGESYGGAKTKNGLGRCFKIDWATMKKNFESMYRYKVEWDEYDDKVMLIDASNKKKPSPTAAKIISMFDDKDASAG